MARGGASESLLAIRIEAAVEPPAAAVATALVAVDVDAEDAARNRRAGVCSAERVAPRERLPARDEGVPIVSPPPTTAAVESNVVVTDEDVVAAAGSNEAVTDGRRRAGVALRDVTVELPCDDIAAAVAAAAACCCA